MVATFQLPTPMRGEGLGPRARFVLGRTDGIGTGARARHAYMLSAPGSFNLCPHVRNYYIIRPRARHCPGRRASVVTLRERPRLEDSDTDGPHAVWPGAQQEHAEVLGA